MSSRGYYGDLTFIRDEEERRRFERLTNKAWGTNKQMHVLLGWMGRQRLKQLNDYIVNIGIE